MEEPEGWLFGVGGTFDGLSIAVSIPPAGARNLRHPLQPAETI